MRLTNTQALLLYPLLLLLSFTPIYPKNPIYFPYGSHMPILLTVVLNTDGPILELGTGHFSTPLLHTVCKKSQRFLLSTESDLNWMNLYASDLTTSWHQFIYVPTFNDWDRIGNDVHWNVVFVDHNPGDSPKRRAIEINRLRSHTDIFVIHDTNHVGYGFETLLPTFKYRYVHKQYDPETTVVSDTIDVTKFFE